MLKYILIFIISISLHASPPNWYINSDIPSKEYELIGYGKGKTKEEANQIAKSDIAKSIQTTVKSNLTINKSTNNGEYSKSINSNVETSTNVNLSDLEVVKTEYIDDNYYIALKYINLPLSKKIRLKFRNIKDIKKETNFYLKKTRLLTELKEEFGFYPKVKIDNGNLIIKNKSFNIDAITLKKLFASVSTNDIKLIQPKSVEYKDFYFIDIKTKKSGYVTLIQIYENGETSILYDNKKLNKNRGFSYPDKNEYDGLEAYLNDGQDKAKDLTIALLCTERKDFSYFDTISSNQEEFTKSYGKIFDMMNSCSVSSEIIKITR